MKVREYQDGDLQKIELQKEQEDTVEYIPPTALVLENEAGIMMVLWWQEIYQGRFFLASIISAKAGRYLFSIIKNLKKTIEMSRVSEEFKAQRLEFTVLKGFKAGERLAILLGFEHEGVLRKMYNGDDYNIYGKVWE